MLVRVAWRDRRDRPAIGSRTWIGNGSDRTRIAKSISPTTISRCCRIRRATTPTPAGASEIRKTTIGCAKIDRRTTTTSAGRPRVGVRGSGDSGCRGPGRPTPPGRSGGRSTAQVGPTPLRTLRPTPLRTMPLRRRNRPRPCLHSTSWSMTTTARRRNCRSTTTPSRRCSTNRRRTRRCRTPASRSMLTRPRWSRIP